MIAVSPSVKKRPTVQPRESNPRGSPDLTLKALARIDQRRAFDRLVLEYRDRLFRHAFYMLGDAEEAFEATQETFLKAYQESALFDPDFKIKPWLFRVITNLCYNMSRDKRRRRGILKTMHAPTSESPQALDKIIQQETKLSVEEALQRIPEKHRAILLLKYYNDLSYVEISQVMGCKLGTVMSRLSRARDKLRNCLTTEA